MDKYEISLEDIREICENSTEFDGIKSLADLMDYFSRKTTKGLWLRDIMVAVGVDAREIAAEKAAKIDWIIDHVQITGLEDSHRKTETGDSQGTAGTAALPHISLADIDMFFENVRETLIKDVSGELGVTSANLYEGMSVEYQDEFCLQYKQGYSELLAAVAKRDENRIIAIGTLQREGSRYHILLDSKNIDYSMFGNTHKFRLVLFDRQIEPLLKKSPLEKSDAIEFAGNIHTIECIINCRPVEKTGNTLCIDFGTSNTAAGSYGLLNRDSSDIELVSFTDVTTPEMKKVKLYPTLVCAEDCRDEKNIKYLFGYSARKKLADCGYDTDASVYFEIKRWIGSLDEIEEIRDEDGNSVEVQRREIVKAYILHIIDLAQQYFKVQFESLHLSAPVKLKERFLKEMKEMLKDEGYTVLSVNSSIDEGIAIIYNSISRLIEKKIIKQDEKTSIMILDCGGGTTDLASCEVSSKDLNTGKKLEIVTKFVNGNSNFGGNNITFRILQLLKIKLAAKFAPEKIESSELKDLIPYEESEILNQVEDDFRRGAYNSDVANVIYADFTRAYERAEEVIPTVYTDNKKFLYTDDRKKIRRNYYYLWQLAEKVKIKFYEEDLVQFDFDRGENKTLVVDTEDNYFLYVNDDGELIKVENPGKEIEITINEIRRILCGDIYGLLNGLLTQQEFNVANYKYYRLAGQSCKITLFMELLKEFIPGRQLRTSTVHKKEEPEEESKGSIRLKLDCIRGSIAYIRDKECGKIKPEIVTDTPRLIYDVYIKRVDNEVPILRRDDCGKIGYATYSKKAARAELVVKNSSGLTERRIVSEFDNNLKEVELDTVFQEVEKRSILSKDAIRQLKDQIIAENPNDSDETDQEMIVFAIPSKEGYGVNIYHVLKIVTNDEQKYAWREPTYENYENESAKSFFDGRR